METNNTIKTAYIQFCGRVVSTEHGDKHIVAAALYSDRELTNIKGLDVCEMTNFEENKKDKFDVYRNRLGEYATALKLVYKYQNALLTQGYDCVALCPSNGKLWTWLHGGRVPAQVRDLYENINKQFRKDGQFQLDICVGLSATVCDKKAYKFCKPEYVGAELCRVKRGVHIMTADEVAAAKAKLEEKRKKEEDKALNQDGVNVFDILQLGQGNELEPIVVFERPEE